MGEEDVASKQEAITGRDGNALAAAFDRNRTADAQITPPLTVQLDARPADQIDKRLAAAVENRHLQVVDFDESVVDAHAVEHAEQMLGGRDQHALAHQAGGVADLLHVAPTSGDGETLQVGTDEDDAGGRRSGKNSD